MAKAYWVACYRSISDPDALAAYAKLAGPAIAAAGGRFLARGNAAKAYEAGVDRNAWSSSSSTASRRRSPRMTAMATRQR